MYIGHFMKPYFKDRVTGVVSGGTLLQSAGLSTLWEGLSFPRLLAVIVSSLGSLRITVFLKLSFIPW
jgi:hypothetical protein